MRSHTMKSLAILVTAFVAAFGCRSGVAAETPRRWTLRTELVGVPIEGMPLAWSDDQLKLLGRDGKLWDIDPARTSNSRKLSSNFNPYSAVEMRAALLQEFGRKLEVTSTGHYVVAHPPGKGGYWAERFEELYRSFVHYFRVRGLTVREPQFPLAAIVWERHEDFVRYATSQGYPPPPGLLGYYSLDTNRIMLFDVGGGNGSRRDWQQNADTIIHEATHQSAFNTGVHSRFAAPPRWVAEGLGMLFEPRGVHDSRNYTFEKDRVNQGRLKQFRQLLAAGRPTGAFVDVVNSDRLFSQNSAAAYAESWALTFYLVETQPRNYCDYLAKTAAGPNFEPYPSARRLADFTSIFGSNLRLLDAKYLEFIGKIGK